MNIRPIKSKKRSLTLLKTGSILTAVMLFDSMAAVLCIWRNSSNVNNSTLVTVSTNSRSPNARIPCPGCGVWGGSTYVSGEVSFNQKDMPVPDILLFYVEVFFNATSFTAGPIGYSTSLVIGVNTNNPFSNWQMISHSFSTGGSSTQITALGNPEFYDAFPLGAYDYWWAYPNVAISIHNDGQIMACIFNQIVAKTFNGVPYIWYNGVVYGGTIGSITAYANVIQYISG